MVPNTWWKWHFSGYTGLCIWGKVKAISTVWIQSQTLRQDMPCHILGLLGIHRELCSSICLVKLKAGQNSCFDMAWGHWFYKYNPPFQNMVLLFDLNTKYYWKGEGVEHLIWTIRKSDLLPRGADKSSKGGSETLLGYTLSNTRCPQCSHPGNFLYLMALLQNDSLDLIYTALLKWHVSVSRRPAPLHFEWSQNGCFNISTANVMLGQTKQVSLCG